MANLDSLEEIKNLDEGHIMESIMALPDQFSQAVEEVSASELPPGLSSASNVVISGMGGSGLGGKIIDSLVPDRARTPIEVFTEFALPNYVGPNTLVIVSSYSGNTEETLACAHEALEKKAKIFGITQGGKLMEFLKDNNLPGYIFDPKHNPSGMPRMGLGYSVGAIITLLARGAFIRFAGEHEEIVTTLRKHLKDFSWEVPQERNLAKAFARKLLGKVPILLASEHLSGVAEAFNRELNENSKVFGASFAIPEANHHLMEGLKFPQKAKDLLTFLFLESEKYSKDVYKRYGLTREVIEKNGYRTLVYTTASESKLSEIFEVLAFGSFVSFYLAMLEDINPAPIPWVDYFKEKLSS